MSFGKASAPPGYSATLASEYTPTKVIENSPGYHITLQIWFAHLWRYFLWMLIPLLIIVVAAIVTGFVIAITGGKEAISATRTIVQTVGFILGAVGGFWAWHKSFRAILGKKFMGYRLVLLTPESASAMDDPTDG